MDAKYTLLIVEDDEDVCRALSSEDEWLRRGFRLAGAAGSAEEALSLCRLHKPDVVLSDIRMAEMSGLEMIEYLTNHGSEAVFVILSGYNRFEYAQTAVRLGVFEYLTKPIDDRKLDATFHRLREQLDVRGGPLRGASSDERAVAAYREIFLTGLLTHQLNETSIRERMRELKLDAPSGRCRIATIRLRRLALEQEAFEDQIARYFACGGQAALLYKGCFVAFLRCATAEEERISIELLNAFQPFATALPGCAQAVVQIGLSSPVPGLSLAGKAYQEALKALDAHFFGPCRLLRYEELSAPPIDPLFEPKASRLCYEIADCVQKPDPAGASNVLDELFRLFERTRPLNVDRVFSICETLCGLLNARLDMIGARRDPEERPLNCERFARADTLDGLCAEMRRRVGRACGRVREYVSAQSNNIVWQAECYIDAHLSERMSVMDVAAAVHVNPDYLSRTFKKATGENLNNRISVRKVERAKEYLRSSRLSVQEIAFRLGFAEYRYFCSLFKKFCGTTPLAYRRSLIEGGGMEDK